MAMTGVLGAKLSISNSPVASTVVLTAGFTVLPFTEVGEIENAGEFGKVFELVTFQNVKVGQKQKFKGGFDAGAVQLVFGQNLSDAGQDAMLAAAEAQTQDNYGIKVEFGDAPPGGGPTTFYYRALVMSFKTQMTTVTNVIKATTQLEINGPILYNAPAYLVDQFLNGDTLSVYAGAPGFKGSNGTAAFPVIDTNTLLFTTGDNVAGTFADNGSQLIVSQGYSINTGAYAIETEVKLSNITTTGFFFGLTDQNAVLQVPIESGHSADTIVANATDAVGFMFDTWMATDHIWLTAVKNGVVATGVDTGIAFVAATYMVLRMEVAQVSGTASFYLNGVLAGTIPNALRLFPVLYTTIAASSRAAASHTVNSQNLYVRNS